MTVISVLITISQIVIAGLAINAFSLLLYALTFNLRDRITWSFALILACEVIMFTSEALGSVSGPLMIDFWLRVEWIGVIVLPAAYLQFSDSLLNTTGKPSRGKRSVTIVIAYLISFAFILGLPFSNYYTIHFFEQQNVYYLTSFALIIPAYYLVCMSMSWYNLIRAYRRTKTPTSKRRMVYILLGALAPALASFPYILFGSSFTGYHSVYFWIVLNVSYLIVSLLTITMAYSVAFYGVSWPDRVVRSRLFKWLLRGPLSAGLVLAVNTIVRRGTENFGPQYSALVPIAMVVTILLCQYLITLLSPYWERLMFFESERSLFDTLHRLEDRLMTQGDLSQFIELILAAVCDRLQVTDACLAMFNAGKIEMFVHIGNYQFNELEPGDLYRYFMDREEKHEIYRKDGQIFIPMIMETIESGNPGFELLGLLCINGLGNKELDSEQSYALDLLSRRTLAVLIDRYRQEKIFSSIKNISPEQEIIQQMRAAGRYDERNLLINEIPTPPEDVSQWVKEALTHYWGGPHLTESPLLDLTIVRKALEEHEGNYTNALRAILRQAIEKTRPEGERRFTGEWILYNILDMKFLEGRKVREIAVRLSMSEADLYRKQKIAIEAVADAILEMELQSRS